MRQLDPLELITWRRGLQENPQYLDVRERWEFALCRLEDSVNIPLGELAERYDEIDGERPVVCICHHGIRSLHAASFLEHEGFVEVVNLAGGIDAWARLADPAVPRY
ncbi:rhodanese-like domain-containing protein [Plasticicumulans sp.]|uniref:rhodanese-like domain-containing protein n=1 Tax=Plasticicumulans sp. TaxID=2307179 RepID=UPI0039252D67